VSRHLDLRWIPSWRVAFGNAQRDDKT